MFFLTRLWIGLFPRSACVSNVGLAKDSWTKLVLALSLTSCQNLLTCEMCFELFVMTHGCISDSSTAHPGSLKVCQRAGKILGIKRFNEGLSPASVPDNEPSPALVFKDKETKFLEKEMKKVHGRDYANQDDNKSNEGSTVPAKLQRAVSTGSLVPKADLPEEAGKCSHGNVGAKKHRRAGRPPSGRQPNRRAIRCTRLKPSAQVRGTSSAHLHSCLVLLDGLNR